MAEPTILVHCALRMGNLGFVCHGIMSLLLLQSSALADSLVESEGLCNLSSGVQGEDESGNDKSYPAFQMANNSEHGSQPGCLHDAVVEGHRPDCTHLAKSWRRWVRKGIMTRFKARDHKK